MFVHLESPAEWRARVLRETAEALDTMSWMYLRLDDRPTSLRYLKAHYFVVTVIAQEKAGNKLDRNCLMAIAQPKEPTA
jgi:hypothetical protein